MNVTEIWSGRRTSHAWAVVSTLLGDHQWHERAAVDQAMTDTGIELTTARSILGQAVNDGLLLTQRSAGGGRIRGYRMPSLAERAETYTGWLTRPSGEPPLAPRDVLHVRLSVRHGSWLLEHALNSVGDPPHVLSRVRPMLGVDIAADGEVAVVTAAVQLPGDAEDQPCCSHCCAPCGAVTDLAATGQLDIILAGRGPGHDWWDDLGGRVDRAWLAAHIRPFHECGLMSDPQRCTDIGRDGEFCGDLGPRTCRQRPEHEACRAERVCGFATDHDGQHTWEVVFA